MAKLLARLIDVVRADLNAMLSEAEDPEKAIKLYLADAKEHLAEGTEGVRAAIKNEERLSQEVKEAEIEIATWTRRAELAVDQKNDSMATEAINEKQIAQRKLAGLIPALETARQQSELARQAISTLRSKIHEVEVNQYALVARAKVAKAQIGTAEAVAKIGDGGALSSIGSMAEKVKDMEADARAASQAAGVGEPTQDERWRNLETGTSVADELAAMKAKRTQPTPV